MGTNKGRDMALTDTRLKNIKPGDKVFQESDGGGLFVEIMTGGAKVWRIRYRLAGKQEKMTLGEYPAYSLAEARQWREACTILVQRGLSPMALKRGDKIDDDTLPEVKELATAFLKKWCSQTVAKVKAQEAEAKEADTVEAFVWRWFAEVAEPANSTPRNIKRVLEKDVLPALGAKQIVDVTVDDVLKKTVHGAPAKKAPTTGSPSPHKRTCRLSP